MIEGLTLIETDGEPFVLDLVLAERLGMARPRDVRQLIERNADEIRGFGPLRCRTAKVELGSGATRDVVEFLLNEAQAVLVAMLSRAPKAPPVRKALISLFRVWRDGRLPAVVAPPEFHVPRSFAEALELAAKQQRAIEAQGERIGLLEAKSGSRPDRMSCLAYARMCGITLSNGQLSRLSKLARQAGERHGRQPESVNDERWGSVLIHHVADLDAAWSFYFRPPVSSDANPASRALPAPSEGGAA